MINTSSCFPIECTSCASLVTKSEVKFATAKNVHIGLTTTQPVCTSIVPSTAACFAQHCPHFFNHNISDSTSPPIIPIPEATKHYMSPNVSTNTRTDFTAFFLRFRHAEDAHPMYKRLFVTHQQLIKLLVDHPAMQPNLDQTFNTPARSKNKVYFMWDFNLRTFQHLVAEVSPQDPHHSPMIGDVVGRAAMAKQLMLDETGKLEAGNANLGYKDNEEVEFGEETKKVVMELDNLGEGCIVCGKTEMDNGNALLVCSRCKEARYCSRECQGKAWKTHKKECIPVAEQ